MTSDLEYMSPVGKIDHCVLIFCFNCYNIIKHEKKKKRLYQKANYDQIIEDIDSGNWTSVVLDDINDMMSRFNDKIKEIEKKHVPIIEITNKKKYAFPSENNTRDKIKEIIYLQRNI